MAKLFKCGLEQNDIGYGFMFEDVNLVIEDVGVGDQERRSVAKRSGLKGEIRWMCRAN
jgi:hypothetical protein